MSPTAPGASTGGFTPSGTPIPPRQPLQSRSDISALLVGESGPIKSSRDARRWLETKGWVLVGEPYDRTKLVRILLSAGLDLSSRTTEKRTDAKLAVFSVAFLLEDDITDNISEALADAVASKALARIESATDKLTTSAAFLAATETKQAETTLALSTVSSQLENVTASLDSLATKLAAAAAAPSGTPRPSWAAVASQGPPTAAGSPPSSIPPPTFNPATSDQHTRLQQRVLRASRTVLVEVDRNHESTPTDRSPSSIFAIREAMNKLLADLDEAEPGEARPAEKTRIRGITALERGAFLFELVSADAARRFREYAKDQYTGLLTGHLGETATVKAKAHNLIVRFVPCGGMFDPSDAEHLAGLEEDNGLHPGAITSASWLKRIDRRSPKQTLASIKLSCDSAETANQLLRQRVYIASHLVAIRKDLKEPIRCNMCQHFGHMRATCTGQEHCALCASTGHKTTECTPNHTPRCVLCGPDSTHSSSSRNCPAFKKLCEDLDTRFPENSMPYFPTGDVGTWVQAPPKRSFAAPVHQPRIDDDQPAPQTGPPAPSGSQPQPPPPRQPPTGPLRQGDLRDFGVSSKPGSQKSRRRESSATLPSQ
ncbi:hypothetical protein FPV67DRAFT_1536105 [Lyophyllum atratum]|nr:hypothetical protein FPV67DRAFT_1536105 [Lyophyllum atratum]